MFVLWRVAEFDEATTVVQFAHSYRRCSRKQYRLNKVRGGQHILWNSATSSESNSKLAPLDRMRRAATIWKKVVLS
ncbi:hypothetical protein ABTE82_18920, partial [Acinetobacter baumannii]